MDIFLGLISLFWDPVFELHIFPFFTSLAFWINRRIEIVFLMFLVHSFACGKIDIFHLVLFIVYSMVYMLGKVIPHLGAYSIFASFQVVYYWVIYGWIQGIIALSAGLLSLLRRTKSER